METDNKNLTDWKTDKRILKTYWHAARYAAWYPTLYVVPLIKMAQNTHFVQFFHELP